MHTGRFSLRVVSQFVVVFSLAAVFLCIPTPGLATPILASDLASFAVLGAETVTNVPASAIVGNVGVSPGEALPGFIYVAGIATADPQVTGGLVHSNTGLAASAQGQLTTARTNLGLLGAGTLLPADLAGLTIFPGVFTVPAGTTNLSGTVTLDGLGNPNAFWLFQMDTLITSSASVVNVINTGAGAGVFWNVGSSALSIGSTTSFEGNILALTSIVLKDFASIGCGRALTDTGEVTLIQNTISLGCLGTGEEGSNGLNGGGLDFIGGTLARVVVAPGQPGAGSVVSVPGTAAVVPEPATLTLLAIGLIGVARWKRRRMGSV